MLFNAYELGGLTLRSRVVMPPMTRARASVDGVPTAAMAQYYAQRASAGLIITEGTQISQQGQGYAWTPGLHTPEQEQGWRRVTAAVHAAGGRIFAQLWHVGRVSHASLQPRGGAPVAPSSVADERLRVFVDADRRGPVAGRVEMVSATPPRAMTVDEIESVRLDYVHAARRALAAGFDGVELHAANGYLLNQFIASSTNLRTDRYGGSLANRLRLLLEVTDAVVAAVGRQRVGVRISPLVTLQGTADAAPLATYTVAAAQLSRRGIAYLHIAEADWDDAPDMPTAFREALRMSFDGAIISAGRYTLERAEETLRRGWADLVAFGRPFVANPDLPLRLQRGLPLNAPDPATFFGGDGRGYTDYPFWDDETVMEG
ncbi:alkene reductase [Massilia arenosa]|uniref:Alkene reductase n=1 Tax=Zemynaea arenosa TaxID=2561931 RepID=A0A4Y9SGH7_9BURK|nr:alkene reductase [Massilia arenosa]TFW23167.1 alkene reductase [Massilia arenosa]